MSQHATEADVTRARREAHLSEAAVGGLLTPTAQAILAEGLADLSRMGDDDLRAARAQFVKARAKCQAKLDELPGSTRYSTSAGSQLYADCEYYSGIIRPLEMEMQSRLLSL